jgi:hypothetical protein
VTPELWAAIAACLGGIGGTVRWAIGRWERAQELNRAAQTRMADEMLETRVLISALLERERIRDRRRRASEQPPARGRQAQAVPVEIPYETTDIIALMDHQRAALSKPQTIRQPRKGTHHDTED